MTRLKLDVQPLAVVEMADALAYYSDISPNLGKQFDEQLDAALALLCASPGLGGRRFAHLYRHIDLRCWSLDRFPFRIFYAVHGNSLRVYRVCHERRNITKALLRKAK